MNQLLTIETRGIAERAEYFAAARERAEDLGPVWDFVHDVWLHEIAQQFMTEGSYFGEGWQPLNPDYAAKKLREVGLPPAPLGILYRTGRLFEALGNEGAQDHLYQATPDSVLLGASGEAARIGSYHQKGNDTLPKRSIIGMRNRFKRTVFRAAVAWITGGQLPRQDEAEGA